MSRKKSNPNIQVVNDSWTNLYTGMGVTGRDQMKHTSIESNTPLDETTIDALYSDEGIGSRIVALQVEDALRKWVTIENEPTGKILTAMEERGVKKHIVRLMEWARAFGGAVLVIGVDDGLRDLKEPLNENSLRNIRYFRVFSRFRISSETIDKDPLSKTYLEPLYFDISPIGGTPFTIHASRCIKVDGIDCSERRRANNLGWGLSVYQNIYDQLLRVGVMFSNLSSIINGYCTDVIHITGLHNLIAAGKESVVQARLNNIDMSRHAMNTTLLDANETYEKVVSSVGGIGEVADRFMNYLCAVTSIPATLLWGRSPAGMNATGESDMNQWYDRVSAYQNDDITPVLERIVSIMFRCSEIYSGSEPTDWHVKFPPLKQMTQAEEATIAKTEADRDAVYIQSGVIDGTEVAKHRFGSGTYKSGPMIEITKDRDELASQQQQEPVEEQPGEEQEEEQPAA